MKKVLFAIYMIPVLAGVLSSCSKKIDDAYLNPNAPLRVPLEQLLPGIIANMVTSYSAAGTGYGPQNDGMYIGRYVQFWATNSTAGQYDQMGGATGGSDALGAIWAMHYYGHGQNLNDMITWATEEEKWDYVGVAYAIRAWGWLQVTDMHGEVILKEAFDRYKRVFQYDTQQDVYEEIKRLSRLAIDNLNRTDGNVSQSKLAVGDEFMNKGNIDKWKKFVYANLAKTFHRLTNKGAAYQPDSVIHYANLAMTTNADNVFMRWSLAGGTGTYSYYSPFRGNVGTLRQTRFAANLLSGGNSAFQDVPDPRAPYLIRENKNGTYKGILPGNGDSANVNFDLSSGDRPFNFWGGEYKLSTAANDNNARYIFKSNPVWPLVTAAEMQFLKAEAYYRKGLKTEALAAYKQGINLNFDQLISDYEGSVPLALRMTPTSREDYIDDPKVTPATADGLTLSHIMLQKYIALYGWGFLETWVDMRRFHYLDQENGLQVYRDFVPPAQLFPDNNGALVYRARPRYNSEYLYNVAELNRLGALALNYHTKEQWFSQQ